MSSLVGISNTITKNSRDLMISYKLQRTISMYRMSQIVMENEKNETPLSICILYLSLELTRLNTFFDFAILSL